MEPLRGGFVESGPSCAHQERFVAELIYPVIGIVIFAIFAAYAAALRKI
jgi:hypothetical protein